jgi:hypothetical protein
VSASSGFGDRAWESREQFFERYSSGFEPGGPLAEAVETRTPSSGPAGGSHPADLKSVGSSATG